MLEKVAGVCMVGKLWAIQLYKADFNCYNQFILGKKAMKTMTDKAYVLEELFSQKGSTAEDAKLNKTLMADISQQARLQMAVVSADTANCYNRVNHIIMSLIWLVLTNGNIPAIVAALVCLQTKRISQRTGYGESKTFFGSIYIIKYIMGLRQGNRGAPLSWIQLSLVLVNVYKQLDLGAHVDNPITGDTIHSMGVLFVDDADLYLGLDGNLSTTKLWTETQASLDQWNLLLSGTGGALKAEKCFWYLLD